jgi:hypothetical protein
VSTVLKITAAGAAIRILPVPDLQLGPQAWIPYQTFHEKDCRDP